jgi:hypothetical protein
MRPPVAAVLDRLLHRGHVLKVRTTRDRDHSDRKIMIAGIADVIT